MRQGEVYRKRYIDPGSGIGVPIGDHLRKRSHRNGGMHLDHERARQRLATRRNIAAKVEIEIFKEGRVDRVYWTANEKHYGRQVPPLLGDKRR